MIETRAGNLANHEDSTAPSDQVVVAPVGLSTRQREART